MEDIMKLVKDDTVLIAPESSAALLAEAGFTNVTAVRPSGSYTVGGVSFLRSRCTISARSSTRSIKTGSVML